MKITAFRDSRILEGFDLCFFLFLFFKHFFLFRNKFVEQPEAGSDEFKSPEMLISHRFGKSTDIWSLGLIFYFILTLDKPMNNPKLNPFDFNNLNFNDIPQEGLCPRAITLFDCIFSKMVVLNEEGRATIEEVIENEAFRDFYQAVEIKALVLQVGDLQGQLLEKCRELEQVRKIVETPSKGVGLCCLVGCKKPLSIDFISWLKIQDRKQLDRDIW